MRIVWDEPKRLLNLNKRGLDFADLTPAFFYAAGTTPAKKGRFAAIGPFQERTITVIFARLGSEAVSVISMRQASKKERDRYEQTKTVD